MPIIVPVLASVLRWLSVMLLNYNEMSHINDYERIYITFLTQISSYKRKVYFCHGSKKYFFTVCFFHMKP